MSSLKKWFGISVAVLGVLVGLLLWLTRPSGPAAGDHPSMTDAERSYLGQIKMTGTQMSEATDYLGATQYYLNGELKNAGAKMIRALDLQLTFLDSFGNLALRTVEEPVTSQTAPLKPGETIAVHFVFDRVPDIWNQGTPTVVASYVHFAK
jgi:hypothetical protein